MKFCNCCGSEMDGKDGENYCQTCEDWIANGGTKNHPAIKQRARRKEREDALKSLGLVKVRGALGGTYWE
jgi:uncharacterized Zn finger protein (UPF0148 family)